MNFIYVLIASLLSLGLIAMISIPLGRVRDSSMIFSASLGIIIFGCMRGIFVECGWGFAALFGIKTGIVVQVILFAAAVLFFRALADENRTAGRDSNIPSLCALICFGLGKGLLRDYSTLYDPKIYALGEAADFAFTALSLEYIGGASGKFSTSALKKASLVMALKTVIVTIYHNAYLSESEFAASVLLLMGMAGFICEFVRALGESRNISAAGFAAGVTISFCISSLEG